jgi:TonB family protein
MRGVSGGSLRRGALVSADVVPSSANDRRTLGGHPHLAMTPLVRDFILAVLAVFAIWSVEPSHASAAPRPRAMVAQSETVVPAKPLPGYPSPPYPEQAREAGVEGDCVFRADVTPEGTVSKVAVLKVPREGLGFEAAIEKAVALWRFEPARRGEAKTASVYVGKISYSLSSVNQGRMYSVSASAAWKKLLEWLARTGIKTKTVDAAHQVVFTKLVNVRGGALPFPATIEGGYVPRRFQIQVFVSPYAEPARVYVASLIEADRQIGRGTEAWVVYNSPIPSTWLLEEFSKYLGDPGRLMPETATARTALADQLRTDASAPACAPSGVSGSVKPPVKFFDLSPVYPARLQAVRRTGQVRYEFFIQEDGSAVFSRFVDSPAIPTALAAVTPEDQAFFDAARAILTFWRFEPTRVGGCPVVSFGYADVNFTIK